MSHIVVILAVSATATVISCFTKLPEWITLANIALCTYVIGYVFGRAIRRAAR